MNHTQIRAFHAVAIEASFTRAARALNVSQPTLSAQVKALEETYGVRLFYRRGRETVLTEIGQRLLEVSARYFALEEEAENLLADNRDLNRGRLVLCADSPSHAMTVMAAIQKRYPGISLSLIMGNAEEVLRSLFDYRADVAVLSRPPIGDARLSLVPFREDRVVAILHKDDALAERARLRLTEIAEQRLIVREEGSVTREIFESALNSAGIVPRDTLEIDSREAVREAVAAGLGIGVVFESEAGRDSAIRAVPIEGGTFTVPVAIACLSDRRRLATLRAAMRLAEEEAVL